MSTLLRIPFQHMKMVKIILAEENLLDYLKSISHTDSNYFGLLIGHSTEAVDYVIHMSRIPIEDGGTDKSFKLYSGQEIKNLVHADSINLLKEKLPGGLTVLGIFFCSSCDIFNELPKQSLRLLLKTKKNEEELYNSDILHGINRYIFHYNPVTQKYICKFFSMTFEPAEWKFQKNCTKWYQISSKFCLHVPPIVIYHKTTLKTGLMKFMKEMRETVNNLVVMVGDRVLHEGQDIKSIINSKGQKKVVNGIEIHSLEASIFTPLPQVPIAIHLQRPTFNKITMEGIVKSETFVSQNATVEDIMEAVKFDIRKSLSTRIQLYLDSLSEEEEKSDLEEAIHALPRRISVSIPNSPFCFFEYIFPEDDCQEIIEQSKVWLDVQVTLNDVNENYEGQSDLSRLCYSNSKKKGRRHSDDLLTSTLPTGFLIAAISFAIILIAIAVALKMQGTAPPDGEFH